jgi:hypothetical protein
MDIPHDISLSQESENFFLLMDGQLFNTDTLAFMDQHQHQQIWDNNVQISYPNLETNFETDLFGVQNFTHDDLSSRV